MNDLVRAAWCCGWHGGEAMATRVFEKGVDNGKSYGITEKKAAGSPADPGDWVNRIVVYGDPNLRDRIMQLLNEHGTED